MKTGSTSTSYGRVLASVTVLVVAVSVLSGCSGSSGYKAPMPAPMAKTTPSALPIAAGSTETTQMCGVCSKKIMPPTISGQPVTDNGVQVLKIAVVDGHYAPNQFTVKAGVPVTAVFTGNTVGCIGKPTFKSLGKSGDMSGGTASLDLGALKPGSYTLECGMGMKQGTVTAQ